MGSELVYALYRSTEARKGSIETQNLTHKIHYWSSASKKCFMRVFWVKHNGVRSKYRIFILWFFAIPGIIVYFTTGISRKYSPRIYAKMAESQTQYYVNLVLLLLSIFSSPFILRIEKNRKTLDSLFCWPRRSDQPVYKWVRGGGYIKETANSLNK